MKTRTNIDFLKYRKVAFMISSIVIVLGIIFFIVRGGFNFGLDFQGGIRAAVSIESKEDIDIDEIRDLLLSNDLPGIEVAERLSDENVIEITYKSSEYEKLETNNEETENGNTDDNENEVVEEEKELTITEIINEKVLPILRERYGEGVVVRALTDEATLDVQSIVTKASENRSLSIISEEPVMETVTEDGEENTYKKYVFRVADKPEDYKIEDFVTYLNNTKLGNRVQYEITEIVETMEVDAYEPTVGKDIQSVAFAVGALIIVLILGYLALRFQFKFGVAAILAVLHDSLVILAILAITGFEVGIQSVTAILTIIGYSLNDTIVVFDRIRENSENIKKEEYMFVVNKSINQVIGRTIITSVTTLLAVLSLLILGGPAIFELAFSISIGIVVGTYSSIFIASPTLIIWEGFLHNRAEKKKAKKMKKADK